MYTTKLAQIENIQEIIEIARQTWPKTYQNILSQGQISYMLDLMYNVDTIAAQMDNGVRFVVIVDKNKTFGFISYENLALNESEPYTKVHKLYVHPDYHGKGVGKKLIQVAEDAARNANIQYLQLNVNKHNISVDFYLANGFYVKKEMVLEIGNGYVMDDFVMEKLVK